MVGDMKRSSGSGQGAGRSSSNRVADISLMFGVSEPSGAQPTYAEPSFSLRSGQLAYVLGPSGSGKSTLLESIACQYPAAIQADRIRFPLSVAVVDRVAEGEATAEAIRYLTMCGLGEPGLWLRAHQEMSAGEQFRARLARAVAHQAVCGGGPLLCDEFCSGLHGRLARAISFNLRRLVSQHGLRVIVAGLREELLPDLRPDCLVRLGPGNEPTVEHRTVIHRKRPTFARRVRIEPGTKRDYAAFAGMHYRGHASLGFVDKVFTLREGRSGFCLGTVVYARPPLELSLRNQATESRFAGNPRLLNQSLRVLRRLIIHPDARGCGLGSYLVRRTLPLVGTEYVECLATMGAFHPVFEAAGMARVGQYPLSAARRKAIAQLESLGVDPRRRDFIGEVRRRPRVRAIVARVVHDWYRRTTVGGEARVARQSPLTLAQTFRGLIGSQPVYYLWRRTRKSRQAA